MPNRKVQSPNGGGQQARREHVVQVEELGLSREVEERGADGGHELERGYSVLLPLVSERERETEREKNTRGGRRWRQSIDRPTLPRDFPYKLKQWQPWTSIPGRRGVTFGSEYKRGHVLKVSAEGGSNGNSPSYGAHFGWLRSVLSLGKKGTGAHSCYGRIGDRTGCK